MSEDARWYGRDWSVVADTREAARECVWREEEAIGSESWGGEGEGESKEDMRGVGGVALQEERGLELGFYGLQIDPLVAVLIAEVLVKSRLRA